MTDKELSKLFDREIATRQRGEPESTMLRVQFAMGGGVLNPIVENIGDLTHRMTEAVTFKTAGYEFVKNKVERSLEKLSRGFVSRLGAHRDEGLRQAFRGTLFAFRQELNNNIENNALYRKISVSEFRAKVNTALDKYAEAHKKIPVFNEVQRAARDAAIAVGERKFEKAAEELEFLNSVLEKGQSEWIKRAHEFEGEAVANNPPVFSSKREDPDFSSFTVTNEEDDAYATLTGSFGKRDAISFIAETHSKNSDIGKLILKSKARLVAYIAWIETVERRKGIGRGLMREALETLYKQGIREVFLVAVPEQHKISLRDLQKFYFSAGFKSWYDDPAVMMAKLPWKPFVVVEEPD